MDIVDRKSAMAAGLTRYFTGKPCGHGHVAQRLTRTARCITCHSIQMAGYHRRPERLEIERQRGTKRRESEEYRQSVAEQGRDWYSRNKDRKHNASKKWRGSTPRGVLNLSLRRALNRKITNNPVTLDELMEMWSNQRGRCLLTGADMTWGGGNGKALPTSVSIDRINTAEGYEPGNVRLVCFWINVARGSLPDGELWSLIRSSLIYHDREEPPQ